MIQNKTENLIKTYLDAGNLFFDAGFSNFKRDTSLVSKLAGAFISKETAKEASQKMIIMFVKENIQLAEMQLRQILLHLDSFDAKNLTPEIVKENFLRFGMMFFESGYSIVKRNTLLRAFIKKDEAIARVKEGTNWYVDNHFEISKSKLISLRMLLHSRLDRTRTD